MNDFREGLTIPDLAAKKAAGERLVMVAVGEVLTATWAERAGVDIIGVGDSLGMTLHGHENTLAMTVDQMIDHCRAVRRGAPNTLCLVSMPYGSYATAEVAVKNAVRLMKESGAEAVKLQGGREMFDIIKAVANCGCSRHEPCWPIAPPRAHAGRVQDAGTDRRRCAENYR